MNHLSIQLSNQAMAHGLALANARGVGSLEELIELMLLEGGDAEPSAGPLASNESAPRRADPPLTPEGTATDTSARQPETGFAVNPPAIALKRPDARPASSLAVDLPPSALPLPFLTNRLNPLKASVRALANLASRDQEWPRLRDFQAKAGHAARERGLQLLSEDRAAGRRGRMKRSVAWPIGSNPAAALERYAFAFTLGADGGVATGPLATLGLATLMAGRVALTGYGWELAVAPSPLLDGGEGTLSDEEAATFRERLLQSPPERAAIAEFVRATRRAAGAQPSIDELLSARHPDWSADQAAAQRSAMIGRLEEVGLVEVTGRGTKAVVVLGDVGDFERDTSERTAA